MAENLSVRGNIDITYHTQQRDMFVSGLAAEIGANAFAVWHAIKSHADFQTGNSWPSIRRLMSLTSLSSDTVQAAIKRLESAHLLRITKHGQRNNYVARERIDVRVGKRVVATVVVDYCPTSMHERLRLLKSATAGDIAAADVWAQVEILPGPGLHFDEKTRTFKTLVRADEVTVTEEVVSAARARIRQQSQEMRSVIRKYPA